MTSAAELIQTIEAEQRERAARVERVDRYKKFYNSRAWRAARYAYLKTLARPLKCMCCGASAQERRLAVDHIIPIRKDWSRRLDPTNFQVLCAVDCNLAKASSDSTDWRAGANKEGATNNADANIR
jgi:5-methylcytosine-specific restriction endonuclease McrA